MKKAAIPLMAAALVAACAGARFSDGALRAAEGTITGEEFIEHVRVLASDAFEGRGPGTPGETLTVDYLTAKFEALGLKPGNPDGRWVQDVPLVGLTEKRSATLAAGGKAMRM